MSPCGLSVLQPFGCRPVVVLAVVGKGVRGVLAGQRVATRFAVAAYAYKVGTRSQVRGGHGARGSTNAYDIALYNVGLVSVVGVERHVPHVQFPTWSYRQFRLPVLRDSKPVPLFLVTLGKRAVGTSVNADFRGRLPRCSRRQHSYRQCKQQGQ